jgi:hypothetical protein
MDLFRIGIQHCKVVDPDPDPLVRGMDRDPAPDPSGKNNKKNLDSYYFVTNLCLLPLKDYVNVPSKSNKNKNFDPYQIVTDPQH